MKINIFKLFKGDRKYFTIVFFILLGLFAVGLITPVLIEREKNDWEKIIEQDGNIDLIVFKAKRGTGVTGKIPLKVDRDKMTVTDREEYGIVDTAEALARPSMFGARRN